MIMAHILTTGLLLAAPGGRHDARGLAPPHSANASHDRPPLGLRGQGYPGCRAGLRRAKQGVAAPRLGH